MTTRKLQQLQKLWWNLALCALVVTTFPWILTAIPHWLGYAPHFAHPLTREQVVYGGSTIVLSWTCLVIFPIIWFGEDTPVWHSLAFAVALFFGLRGVFAFSKTNVVFSGSLDDIVRWTALSFLLLAPAGLWLFSDRAVRKFMNSETSAA